MVRPPYFDRNGMKKGAWSEEEDNKLRAYILRYGHWNWRLLPKYAGLARCGKSCRLRWVNYLKPGVIKGNFTNQEEHLIIQLHAQLGNKWSAIASRFPGRTDNDIKNFWHTRIHKRHRRSEAPKYKKVTLIGQSSEANSSKGYDNNQVLEEQKVSVWEETLNESGSLDAASSQSSDDIFQVSSDNTDYCALIDEYFFPPILEEELFYYSQSHECSEFSSSDFINADDGNSSNYVGGENLWTGSFASDDTSNHQCDISGASLQDQVGGFYDPFVYFDV